jgi:stringent starvation protein B
MFDKRGTIEALLECGEPLRIHVDSRKEGVKLPMQWMSLPAVPLDISPAVNNYKAEADALRVYMGFSGMWVTVVLPWASITHAMRNGEGAIVWAAEVDRPPPAARPLVTDTPLSRPTRVKYLRIIDGGKGRAEFPEPNPGSAA